MSGCMHNLGTCECFRDEDELRARAERAEEWLKYTNELEKRLAEARGLLTRVLDEVVNCQCEEAYISRRLHAPECKADEVDDVRAFLAGQEDAP